MKRISYLIIILFLFIPGVVVTAQGITPSIVDTTIPVDEIIKSDINAWLEENAPGNFPYWAITAVDETEQQNNKFVSMVALNLEDPSDKDWHIADADLVLWMGSVIVNEDHTVVIYSDGGFEDEQAKSNGGAKFAIPKIRWRRIKCPFPVGFWRIDDVRHARDTCGRRRSGLCSRL